MALYFYPPERKQEAFAEIVRLQMLNHARALRAFGSEPPSVATILEATKAGGDFAAPMLPALCTGFRLPHGCAVKFIAGGQRHPLADQCRARKAAA